jgi:hypothetical protein
MNLPFYRKESKLKMNLDIQDIIKMEQKYSRTQKFCLWSLGLYKKHVFEVLKVKLSLCLTN